VEVISNEEVVKMEEEMKPIVEEMRREMIINSVDLLIGRYGIYEILDALFDVLKVMKIEKNNNWKKKYPEKTILLVLNRKVIFADKDPKKVEKRRSSFFEPLLRVKVDIVHIPTEAETKEEIQKDIDELSEKYGIDNILKAMIWAHKEDLIRLKSVPPLNSVSFPKITEKGKEWIYKKNKIGD